jgi:hypothetical protein
VRGAKPAAKPAAAVAAAAKAPAKANGNGHTAQPSGDFAPGTRIKYNDGSGWITGVVESLEPAILKLEDNSIIRTSRDVLLAGAAEGIIVRL